MAVFSKKEEKVNAIFEAMENINDKQEFKNKFKAMYPDDWNKVKVKAKFNKEERDTKPGKNHPMPHPDIYLSNMYKIGLKKFKESRGE